MASKQMFLIIFFNIAVAVLPALTLAKEFIVGDNSGWTINFDYQAWVKDKEFHVGDKLVFKYPLEAHNVHKVNATGFQNCEVPAGLEGFLATGNDVVVLATPGKKWYICGVGKHCEVGGQKLAITVLAGEVTSPAASPPQSLAPASSFANAIAASGLQAFGAVLFLVIMVFMA